MNKRERRVFTEEIKRESVRLIETSGRSIAQIAEDLGVGLSTLARESAFEEAYCKSDLMLERQEWADFTNEPAVTYVEPNDNPEPIAAILKN